MNSSGHSRATSRSNCLPELHAPELVELRLELLNLQIALGKPGAGLNQQGSQGFNIVRKFSAVRHAAQFTSLAVIFRPSNSRSR